jgi:ribosome-associated toxin RatA of RatAB toxin-antitoxin module
LEIWLPKVRVILGTAAILLELYASPGGAADSPPNGFPSAPVATNDVAIERITNSDGIDGLRATFQIKASREAIWKMLIDYKRFRDLFENLEDISVLEETERGARVHYRIRAAMMHFEYTLQRDYEQPGRRLTWHRIDGAFKSMSGVWEIREGSDFAHHVVICESFVDIGHLIPTALVRRGASNDMRKMAIRLRQLLEGTSQKR